MSLFSPLFGFALRQVLGDGIENVVAAVQQRFRDHSQTLPNALQRAHERAWQALEIALAGDGFLDQVKVFFASGDDKGVREQVMGFLQGNAVSFVGTPAEFRQACLGEIKRLRKSGLLSSQAVAIADVTSQAAGFLRYTDGQGQIEGARMVVGCLADALRENCPNLSQLLRTPPPIGPPLLVAAFAFFFRREVETDEELAHGLFFDGLRQLTASQAKAFIEVNKALATLGGQFDALIEQQGRIEAGVVATHEAVLDIQAELIRLGQIESSNKGEVCALLAQVLRELSQWGMQRGEVRPQHSMSIRGEDERRVVQALLDRFRKLSSTEQKQVPAMLNGLGKLQVGAGDFSGAVQSFVEVARIAPGADAKAEAHANAYRAALERRDWPTALAELRQAASLHPGRFAPFPLHRYEPHQILGAGGFGTAFLCHDHHFEEGVVVKTLHTGCLDRGVDELFREARTLRRLTHPAIIGVRDCEYADPDRRARPYLVMDHFPGGTLQQFVDERGALSLQPMLAVAAQVAAGMKAAHDQGVLHRDLKPANILVRKEGDLWKVKIIDFGLALRQQAVETSKMQAVGTPKSRLGWSVAGTLEYAPPEQLGKLPGVQSGPYSDAYAFARTCCYAMFKVTELRRRHWESLPGPLVDLLEQCLDPDPRQRPRGFEPVLAVLGELLGAGEDARRRAQVEEQRQQTEGEEQLRRLLRTALDRTQGKPTQDDIASARELCGRCKLPADRINVVVREVKDAWRVAEQVRQEAARVATELRPVVSAAGGGTHRTITEAIRTARPGAEIRIRPGIYREGLILNKPISLLGDGPLEEVVIESAMASCILADTDGGVVRGLTLRCIAGSEDEEFSAVNISRGNLLLENCDITSDSLACVAIHGGASTPTIRACKIHHSQQSGVHVYDQGKGTIEGCDIFANAGEGVEISAGADPTVLDCKIHDNKESCGVFVSEYGKGTFERCDIFANKLAGFGIKQGADPTVRDCKIRYGEGGGVFVYEQGKGTFERCDIFANKFSGIDIIEGGNPTIRDCKIHDNKEGGVVVDEQGKGTIEGCDIFGNAGEGVEISAGGDPTVRDCKIHDGVEGGVYVTGKGKGTIEGCDIFANAGAGMEISAAGDPTVRDCKIHDSKEGVGVHVFAGKGTFERCDIFANQNAGVMIQEGGDPTVRDCQIHDSKEGGGVYVYDQGKGTVENCDIFGSKLAGVDIKQDSNPIIRNCKIHDSMEGCGVFVTDQGKGTIEGCDIFANAWAGVEITLGSNPIVLSCKIHEGQSGVEVSDQGKGVIEGCDIFDNADAGVEIKQGGDPTVRDCKIHDNKDAGVFVYAEGKGTIEGCDLRGNLQGAWRIKDGCQVRRIRNSETALREQQQGDRYSQFLALLEDPSHYVKVSDVPVFDAHQEVYFLDPKGKMCSASSPGARKKVKTFDRATLEEIARNCNARDRTGTLAPITKGHTIPDEHDEAKQPVILGYAKDYRVRWDDRLGKFVIAANYYIRSEAEKEARSYPRTSVELWPGDDIIDPIALLRRTPQRDLGQWTYGKENQHTPARCSAWRYSRAGRPVLRYAMETRPMSEPWEDENEAGILGGSLVEDVAPEQETERPERAALPCEITNSIGMNLLLIPKGTFYMGSPEGEADRSADEGPQHEVEITRPFYLGVYPVTVGQFRAFVQATNYKTEAERSGGAHRWTGSEWKLDASTNWRNPGWQQADEFPVTCVSWNDAIAFCDWASDNESGHLYRLPTEAEWEYSCRGGATSSQAFHFGNSLSSSQANFDGNYPYGGADEGPNLRRACKVGSYNANAFGLYDMHGNVWEWCADWHDKVYYGKSLQHDPPGSPEGSGRVLRGGSWRGDGQRCRSAYRGWSAPAARSHDMGFRVALIPPDPK